MTRYSKNLGGDALPLSTPMSSGFSGGILEVMMRRFKEAPVTLGAI